MSKATFKFDPVEMATRTSDAYNAPFYASWTACARLLASRGYDAKQAEAILRSKWMRFARDDCRHHLPTSGSLARWLDKMGYTPADPAVFDITSQHWGEALVEAVA